MLGQKNVACPSLHALREIDALSGREVDGGVGVTFKQNICLAHSLNDGKELLPMCPTVHVCLHSDVSKGGIQWDPIHILPYTMFLCVLAAGYVCV